MLHRYIFPQAAAAGGAADLLGPLSSQPISLINSVDLASASQFQSQGDFLGLSSSAAVAVDNKKAKKVGSHGHNY